MNKNKLIGKTRNTWTPPWRYKESFFIAFELLLLGFAFEAITGGRGISPIQFPYNLIIGVVFLAVLILGYVLFRNKPVVKWLSSIPAAIGAIFLFSLLVLLLGFLSQNEPDASKLLRLTGLNHVKTSWPFLLSQLFFMLTLGMVAIRRAIPLKRKNIGFLLNHIGLWLVIFAAGLGAGDLRRLTVNLTENQDFKNLGMDNYQNIYELPFSLRLDDFSIDFYNPKIALVDVKTGIIRHEKGRNLEMIEEGLLMELSKWEIKVDTFLKSAIPALNKRFEPSDTVGTTTAAFVQISQKGKMVTSGWVSAGSFRFAPTYLLIDENDFIAITKPEPKKYSSQVQVKVNGTIENHYIEVNKPHKVSGWKIYQMGYDTQMGQWSTLSVLEVVKDPWLPVVYVGLFMLLAGAAYLFWIGKDKLQE